MVLASAAIGVMPMIHSSSVTADNQEVEKRPLLPKQPYRHTNIVFPDHFHTAGAGRLSEDA